MIDVGEINGRALHIIKECERTGVPGHSRLAIQRNIERWRDLGVMPSFVCNLYLAKVFRSKNQQELKSIFADGIRLVTCHGCGRPFLMAKKTHENGARMCDCGCRTFISIPSAKGKEL